MCNLCGGIAPSLWMAGLVQRCYYVAIRMLRVQRRQRKARQITGYLPCGESLMRPFFLYVSGMYVCELKMFFSFPSTVLNQESDTSW